MVLGPSCLADKVKIVPLIASKADLFGDRLWGSINDAVLEDHRIRRSEFSKLSSYCRKAENYTKVNKIGQGAGCVVWRVWEHPAQNFTGWPFCWAHGSIGQEMAMREIRLDEMTTGEAVELQDTNT